MMDKKRKAGVLGAENPYKKSKRSAPIEQSTNQLADLGSRLSTASAVDVAETAKLRDKSRKRTVDFLSDDEDNVSAESGKASKGVLVGGSADRPKKTKKSKTKAAAAPTQLVAVQQSVSVPRTTTSMDMQKRKHEKSVPSAPLPAVVETPANVAKKKRGPTTSDVAADRFRKLIATPVLEWPDKHKKRRMQKLTAEGPSEVTVAAATAAPAMTFTADGVNGVEESAYSDKLELVTTKDTQSVSMQAEAQSTVEKEKEDEFGGPDGVEDKAEDYDAALLAGFDSDGDDGAQDKDLGTSKPLPEIPKKAQKEIAKAGREGATDGPGTVYVGRIPHGFYENQMREYFSQFGDITKLRLSRNRRTGASKHFAFIEFASSEVAQIVAKTMDNYLMFGHILKCKFAPQEGLHPELWKGANQRFKKVPYIKIEKRALEAPKSKEQWEKKVAKEQKKREIKAREMKKLGYEMELPKLKQPGEVLEQNKLENAEQQKLLDPLRYGEASARIIESPNGLAKDEVARHVDMKATKKKSKNTKTRQTDVLNTSAPRGSPDKPTKPAESQTESPNIAAAVLNEQKDKKKKSKVRKVEASSAKEPSSVPDDEVAPSKKEKVKKRKSNAKIIETHDSKKPRGTAGA